MKRKLILALFAALFSTLFASVGATADDSSGSEPIASEGNGDC